MSRRQKLPINQRHRPECRRPRQCDCPWSFRMVMPDGSMTRVTKPNWDEAEAAWRDLKSTVKSGGPLPDKTTTVAQWADRWLEAGDRRPSTMSGYRSTIDLYIKPEFGDCLVIAVQPDQVRLWVARLHQQGPVGKQARDGNAAVGKAVKLLHAMYAQWQKDRRYLPYGNPVDSGLAPDPPPKMFEPLTVAEVHRLATAMPPEAALIVETEAFYGPRVSEVLALREEDFTFTGKDPAAPLGPQLAALARLSPAEYEARKPRIRFGRRVDRSRQQAPMKNRRGYRFLPFPQHMAAAYAAQLAAWPPAAGWVFVNREWRCKPPQAAGAGPYRRAAPEPTSRIGRREERAARAPVLLPYEIKSYLRRLIRAAARAGVAFAPNQCSHALRHHCVSVLRDKHWSDQAIADWIGDSARTVTTTYGRPMADSMDRVAADLSALHKQARAGRHLQAVQ